jgi:hypothetical protein
MPITHAKVSSKSDGADTSVVRPSDWNANHVGVATARYIRTSADYTTASASFSDVDGTNMALTITTEARRVLVGLVGSSTVNNTAGVVEFDIMVDGVAEGGTDGLVAIFQHSTASELSNASFTHMTDILSAGSHTFKLRWRVTNAAHTATLKGGFPVSVFWVMEVA